MATGGAGGVQPPPEEHRPASASRIRQHYEHHGTIVPPPLDRGFPTGTVRPMSAQTADEEVVKRRHRHVATKRPQLVVHVHLREKTIDINVGPGTQKALRPALTACQRELQQYDSYQHEYASELTPRGVITEQLERLENRARIRDELQAGDHVWVDVGDGDPRSDVKARQMAGSVCDTNQTSLDEQRGAAEQEHISWGPDENPADSRPVMSNARAASAARHHARAFSGSAAADSCASRSARGGCWSFWLHAARL